MEGPHNVPLLFPGFPLLAAAAAERGPYLSHQHREGKGFCLFVHCCFLSTYDLELLDEGQLVRP